jgi:hypothetical protein
MFDSKPNSTATGAVAAVAASVLNTGERKNFHYIHNIYDPDKHPVDDLNKYVVPQEGELVFDPPNGVIYIVDKVDWQATLKSTLLPWRITNIDEGNTSEQDWIFGLRGGPLLGEALLSVDYSVRPNVARCDSTIMRPGAAYAYVFLGNDASENGKIISAQYDKSLNLLNNKVPCKLAEIVDRTNLSIMTTGTFSVTENEQSLIDGTRCWLVFYDEGGNFIPPAQPLMVQHCAYMRDHEIGIKYVTGIELLSPWFTNTTDPNRMIVPINVELLSVELRAIVHYSDGSQSEPMPVNGTKFNLYGLGAYRPTWPGQVSELSLTYKLDADEQHQIAKPGSPDHESRLYYLQAGDPIGAYTPKIYTYPQWDAETGGYILKHYLFDLDRKTRIDVTEFVTLNDKSPAYRPRSYGVAQSMIFNLNLRDVAPTYESVIFIQHTGITLYKDVNGPGKRWEVSYSQDMPYFGGKVVNVKNSGSKTTFNLASGNGQRDQVDWLKDLYRAISPAYDPRNEDKAPDPTHFDFMNEAGQKWRFPLANWNTDNLIGIELQKGKTWFISWVNRDSSGAELQLGLTGVVVEPV